MAFIMVEASSVKESGELFDGLAQHASTGRRARCLT